jgi:hypothetical protein
VLGGLIHKYYAAATRIGTRCGESRFSTPYTPPATNLQRLGRGSL